MTIAALESVLTETVSLFHKLTRAAADIHGKGELTAALRGLLKGLSMTGPQSVPQMARSRPVSRQLIQKLVNVLRDEDLVELVKNPAHKRSILVRLTSKGESAVKEMIRKERELLSKVPIPVSAEELDNTAQTLRAIKTFLESSQFREALTNINK